MRSVTVTYSLTLDQFIIACNALWSHQAVGKNGNLVVAAALAFLAAATMGVAPSIAGVFVLIALFFALASPLRDWRWRRHYAVQTKYSAPITVIFGPDGIDFRSAEGTFVQPWRVFDAFTETKDFIFLHVGLPKARRQFSVIPKSALSRPGDLSALMAHVSANLPMRRKRWL